MTHYCRGYFDAVCDTLGINKDYIIKTVYGKLYGKEFIVENECTTIKAHCVWCARAEYVLMKKSVKSYSQE